MFKEITIEDLLDMNEKDHTIIDVRSPKEFNEATIPDSKNIPVFNNDERAEIGTLYKQVSQEAAKERGLEMFSKKLPNFMKEFQTLQTPLTVFCWRGGIRSKTAATMLDLMEIPVNRLQGGIRSYRHWVMSKLEEKFQPSLYVLEGYTGTGKTVILEKLAADGYPTINLEKLAGHRGSIFGQIGMQPNNQKTFDTLLVQDLIRLKDEPFALIEGESKRIGNVSLPDTLYRQKENGINFIIKMPMQERINNILAEYHPEHFHAQFMEAFRHVKKRIHPPIAKEIEASLHNHSFETAIQLLLEHYYDPRYDHANKDHLHDDKNVINAVNIEDAYEQFKKIIQYPNQR